jgi:hypothetical protein
MNDLDEESFEGEDGDNLDIEDENTSNVENDSKLENDDISPEESEIIPEKTDTDLLNELKVKYEDLTIKNQELLDENNQFKSIINDLARRLQNAQYTIDAQRKISNESVSKASKIGRELETISRKYQLEIAKSSSVNRKKSKYEEAKKYELEKKRTEKYQEELRFALIDHSMSGHPKEPNSLKKLKLKLQEAEAKQDSMKTMVFCYLN